MGFRTGADAGGDEESGGSTARQQRRTAGGGGGHGDGTRRADADYWRFMPSGRGRFQRLLCASLLIASIRW